MQPQPIMLRMWRNIFLKIIILIVRLPARQALLELNFGIDRLRLVIQDCRLAK